MRPGSKATMSKGLDPLVLDSDISYVSNGRRSVDRAFPPAWSSGGSDMSRFSNGSDLEIYSPGSSSPFYGGRKSIDNNASHSPLAQDLSSSSQESETFSWPSSSQPQVSKIKIKIYFFDLVANF